MSTASAKAKCTHYQWTTDAITGQKMCLACGENPVQKKVPLGYEKRLLAIPGVRPASGWVNEGWGKLQPKTSKAAADLIDQWNADCKDNGMRVEYRLATTPLICTKCNVKVSETYKGDVCLQCHLQEKMQMAKEPKVSKSNPNFDVNGMPIWKTNEKNTVTYDKWGPPAKSVKTVATVTAKPLLVMMPKAPVKHSEGDIWDLPAVNAPFMSKQWGYQGSSSTPYIITRYQTKRDGAVTKDGWACSCMNFTRKTPRTECKHILKVMMQSGVKPTAEAKMAGVADDTLKAFQKWQREQAAAGVAGVVAVKEPGKLNMFENKGRKIR